MKWLNRLERNYGRFAIHHVGLWIVILNVIGFGLINAKPNLINLLLLDRERVMQGEFWRLFTYLMIPSTTSLFWIIFALGYTYMIAEGLEQEWGAFRLNCYILIGMISTTVIAFFLSYGGVSNTYLATSLGLAFATIYPECVIYLLFIIPVKMKWIGWATAIFLAFEFLFGGLEGRLVILVSVANYFLFFWELIRERVALRMKVSKVRSRWKIVEPGEMGDSFHECAVCHRTEIESPDLGFRVASDGKEYCEEHLPSRTPRSA